MSGQTAKTSSCTEVPDAAPQASPVRLVCFWALLGLLILLEYLLFRQYVRTEIAWAHPAAYDQNGYLGQTYYAYVCVKHQGLIRGLWSATRIPADSGVLLTLGGCLTLLLTGPGRLGALTLNFGFFALLQLTFAYTLLWLTGRRSLAFLAVGLLLAAASPLAAIGGLVDFRVDFAAYCLYGVFAAMLVRCGLFRSRPWSLLAGLAGALCVLARFASVLYFAAALGSVLLYFLTQRARSRAADTACMNRRVVNLLLCGGIIVAVVTPFLMKHRARLREHYVTHVTSSDHLVRQREFGTETLLRRSMFYPRSILFDHVGKLLMVLALTFLSVAVFLRGRGNHGPAVAGSAFGGVLMCALCPPLILTIYPSPSPIVGGIVVPCLILAAALAVARLTGPRPAAAARWATGTMAIVALTAGGLFYLDNLSRQSMYSALHEQEDQLLAMEEAICGHCFFAGWKTPRIAVNHISEFLACPLGPFAFERHGTMLRPQLILGTNVSEPLTEQMAAEAARNCDFFLVADPAPVQEIYPFNIAAAPLVPRVHALCRESLLSLGVFDVYGHRVTVYARPGVKLKTPWPDWISSAGLTVLAPATVLAERPVITLSGPARGIQLLGHIPGVRAVVREPDGKDRPVDVCLRADGEHYRIRLVVDSPQPCGNLIEIHLSFDSYFVPREMGLNADGRQLVLETPDFVQLTHMDGDRADSRNPCACGAGTAETSTASAVKTPCR